MSEFRLPFDPLPAATPDQFDAHPHQDRPKAAIERKPTSSAASSLLLEQIVTGSRSTDWLQRSLERIRTLLPLSSITDRSMAGTDGFNVVLVETHNRCTRQCWFCKFGQDRQDPDEQVMSEAMLLRIADNLHALDYAGRISPFGINEPLLDPRLIDILKLFRVKCPKAFLSLNTNGDRLTESLLQQLFTAGLDALGISIYDDLGFKRLAAYGQDPRVALLDMRQPEAQIENRGGQVKVNGDRFHPDSFSQSPCARPSNMLVIRPTGNVVLCCADMYSDVVMGNVSESRLEEIWYSEAFRRYRHELATQGRANLKLCQNCSHNGLTSSIHYPMSNQAAAIAP